MRFGAFFAAVRRSSSQKSLSDANDRSSRATPAGLTMRQRGGGFCIDPEQARSDQRIMRLRSSSIQNHSADCSGVVRVR
jgi:hypothetical protein